jgi:hypothetical protein
MVNYRVANLERMLAQLRRKGVTVERLRIMITDGLPGSPTRKAIASMLWEPKKK